MIETKPINTIKKELEETTDDNQYETIRENNLFKYNKTLKELREIEKELSPLQERKQNELTDDESVRLKDLQKKQKNKLKQLNEVKKRADVIIYSGIKPYKIYSKKIDSFEKSKNKIMDEFNFKKAFRESDLLLNRIKTGRKLNTKRIGSFFSKQVKVSADKDLLAIHKMATESSAIVKNEDVRIILIPLYRTQIITR